MYKACVTGKKKGPKPTTAQAVEALWEMMREMIGKQAGEWTRVERRLKVDLADQGREIVCCGLF